MESQHEATQVVSSEATYSILTAPPGVYVEGDAQDVSTVVFETGGIVMQEGDEQDQQQLQEQAENDYEDDLEEYMSVITTYQCKVCDYSSVDLQQFTYHVKSAHKKRSNVNQQVAQVSAAVDAKPSVIENVEPEQHQTHVVHEINSEFVAETNRSELINGITQDSEVQVVENPETQDGTESTMDSNRQELIHSVQGQGPDGVITYEIDPSNPSVLLNTEAEASDKELFVCATCGLAFSNIETCKDHMIQDHNVSVDDLSSHTEPLSNLVSVGTQSAPRKKPGRKKAEDRPPLSPPASVIMVSDDEEGEELTDQIEEYETNVKRKVRPPKSLTSLYYMDKPRSSRVNPRGHRTNPMSCPINHCTACFKTKEALDLHLTCHLPRDKKEKKPWECPTCKQQFNQWKQIRMHLWSEHQQDTDLLKCPQCEFRSDSQHRLDAHNELHEMEKEKQFTCYVCGKVFKSRWMLRDHSLVHSKANNLSKNRRVKTSEKSDKWFSGRRCPICNRTLANERCLNKHIEAVHDKSKLFQCPNCSYVATRKADMQMHIRSHTGEKPFSCEHCDFKTADHNTLRRHVMRHTGVKPYKCKLCNHTSIQAISLKNHIKNRHGGQGLYSCSQCNYATVNERLYLNHLEDHKNGLVTAKPITSADQYGQVIEVIRKGHLDVIQPNEPGSHLIYTTVNAGNDNLEVTNEVPQTITLHMPNGQENMEISNGNEQQVVMIQEDGAASQDGVTFAAHTEGQIVHTLNQLSEEMMQAISASCSSGQQVTINIAGETGELIITTTEGEVIDMGKQQIDIQQVVEQEPEYIEPMEQSIEQQSIGQSIEQQSIGQSIEQQSITQSIEQQTIDQSNVIQLSSSDTQSTVIVTQGSESL